MECKTISSRKAARSATTLIEFVVAGAVVLIAATSVAAVYVYFLRSFAGLENHMTMNTRGRYALDRFTRDIRQAEGVLSVATNQFVLQMAGKKVRFQYNPETKMVTRHGTGEPEVILTDCTSWKYDMFLRSPKTNSADLYLTTSPASCKVIQLSWTCTRSILGTKLNVEDAQSAKIVIRKQKS